jgi:hypothetical protein
MAHQLARRYHLQLGSAMCHVHWELSGHVRASLNTTETLKTIKQEPDESLREYKKCFYNARNVIPYI